MGLFKAIGGAFKGIGKLVGKGFSFLKKVFDSPLGKLALTVGLSMIPGGALVKGLGALSKLGNLGKAIQTIAPFAEKFLGASQNLLSGNMLKTLSSFIGKAQNSGDLLSIANSLFNARQNVQQPKDDSFEMAKQNPQILMAYYQAMLARQQLMGSGT